MDEINSLITSDEHVDIEELEGSESDEEDDFFDDNDETTSLMPMITSDVYPVPISSSSVINDKPFDQPNAEKCCKRRRGRPRNSGKSSGKYPSLLSKNRKMKSFRMGTLKRMKSGEKVDFSPYGALSGEETSSFDSENSALINEKERTSVILEDLPYFTEQWPGKSCALCNLGEKSQLGQGEILRLFCPEGYTLKPVINELSKNFSNASKPNDSLDKNSKAPVTCRRQKGFNKCRQLSSSNEYVDELTLVGFAEQPDMTVIFETSGRFYVHRNCAVWSHGVIQNESSALENVGPIVSEASARKCAFCDHYGASIMCKYEFCAKFYHFPCASASGSFQALTNLTLYCPEHLSQVTAAPELVTCHICKCAGDVANLMFCSLCGDHYHGICVGLPQLPNVRAGWQCKKCKTCQVCRMIGDESKLMTCEQCDKAYHAGCQRPVVTSIPKYGWKCRCCRICGDCGSRTPGSGLSSRWHSHYTVCDSCYQQRNKGFCCPLCRKAYRAHAHREMVQCIMCRKFVHGTCDPDADLSSYQQKKEVNSDYEYICSLCKSLTQGDQQITKITYGEDSLDGSLSHDFFDDGADLEISSMNDTSRAIGLGKGKPFIASKIAKKRVLQSTATLNRSRLTCGKNIFGGANYNRRQRIVELEQKGLMKLKFRGSFGMHGVGLQKPIADGKPTDEPGFENKLVLCSTQDKFLLSQDLCVMCGSLGTDQEGCLISCAQCGQCYHPYCVNVKVTEVILQRGWRCLDCTVCEGCGERNDEAKLILCDDCDISYHIYCMDPPLEYVPQGNWKCKWCAVCHSCGSKDPGFNSSWMKSYTECGPCASFVHCPSCLEAYVDGDLVIKCDQCERWLHGTCDSIRTEEDAEKCAERGYNCILCRPSDVPPTHLITKTVVKSTSLAKNMDQRIGSNYFMDGICLSEAGNCHMKNLTIERSLTRKKRKRLLNTRDKEAGIMETIESVVAGSILDENSKDNDDSQQNREDIHKEGMIWTKNDGPPPEGFTVFTMDSGVSVLRRKRQRNLTKLGIGGFLVRMRGVKGQEYDDYDGLLNHSALEGFDTPICIDEDKPRKRSIKRRPKSRLVDTFPPYLQEAFFGKDLLDLTKDIDSSSSEDEKKNTRGSGHDVKVASDHNAFKQINKGKIVPPENKIIKLSPSQHDKCDNEDLETVNIKTEVIHKPTTTYVKEKMDTRKEMVNQCLIKNIKTEVTDNDEKYFESNVGTTVVKHPENMLQGLLADEIQDHERNKKFQTQILYEKPQVAYQNSGKHKQASSMALNINQASNSPKHFPSHSPYNSEYSSSPQISPAFSEPMSPWVSVADTNDVETPVVVPTTYNQRSSEKMKADEGLGSAATISAVLYANINHPEWKTEYPTWNDRYKQVIKKWRTLTSDQKAPYLQQARDNRSALRMKKQQQDHEKAAFQQKTLREVEQERQWKQLQIQRQQQAQQQLVGEHSRITDCGQNKLYTDMELNNINDHNSNEMPPANNNGGFCQPLPPGINRSGVVVKKETGIVLNSPKTVQAQYRDIDPNARARLIAHEQQRLLNVNNPNLSPNSFAINNQSHNIAKCQSPQIQSAPAIEPSQLRDTLSQGLNHKQLNFHNPNTMSDTKPNIRDISDNVNVDIEKFPPQTGPMVELQNVSDILGGIVDDDDELLAEMGADFNILEYADPELEAISGRTNILDLELEDESLKCDKRAKAAGSKRVPLHPNTSHSNEEPQSILMNNSTLPANESNNVINTNTNHLSMTNESAIQGLITDQNQQQRMEVVNHAVNRNVQGYAIVNQLKCGKSGDVIQNPQIIQTQSEQPLFTHGQPSAIQTTTNMGHNIKLQLSRMVNPTMTKLQQPPPPYPGPPPPYPGSQTKDQPLLLEDLLQQEKREQDNLESSFHRTNPVKLNAGDICKIEDTTQRQADPTLTRQKEENLIYEQWLKQQSNSLNEQLKYYETEVQKLRKIRKSLNSKQRQLKKSGSVLSDVDASELKRVASEQAVLQKHLESSRKQNKQHGVLVQEFRSKQAGEMSLSMQVPNQQVPSSPITLLSPNSTNTFSVPTTSILLKQELGLPVTSFSSTTTPLSPYNAMPNKSVVLNATSAFVNNLETDSSNSGSNMSFAQQLSPKQYTMVSMGVNAPCRTTYTTNTPNDVLINVSQMPNISKTNLAKMHQAIPSPDNIATLNTLENSNDNRASLQLTDRRYQQHIMQSPTQQNTNLQVVNNLNEEQLLNQHKIKSHLVLQCNTNDRSGTPNTVAFSDATKFQIYQIKPKQVNLQARLAQDMQSPPSSISPHSPMITQVLSPQPQNIITFTHCVPNEPRTPTTPTQYIQRSPIQRVVSVNDSFVHSPYKPIHTQEDLINSGYTPTSPTISSPSVVPNTSPGGNMQLYKPQTTLDQYGNSINDNLLNDGNNTSNILTQFPPNIGNMKLGLKGGSPMWNTEAKINERLAFYSGGSNNDKNLQLQGQTQEDKIPANADSFLQATRQSTSAESTENINTSTCTYGKTTQDNKFASTLSTHKIETNTSASDVKQLNATNIVDYEDDNNTILSKEISLSSVAAQQDVEDISGIESYIQEDIVSTINSPLDSEQITEEYLLFSGNMVDNLTCSSESVDNTDITNYIDRNTNQHSYFSTSDQHFGETTKANIVTNNTQSPIAVQSDIMDQTPKQYENTNVNNAVKQVEVQSIGGSSYVQHNMNNEVTKEINTNQTASITGTNPLVTSASSVDAQFIPSSKTIPIIGLDRMTFNPQSTAQVTNVVKSLHSCPVNISQAPLTFQPSSSMSNNKPTTTTFPSNMLFQQNLGDNNSKVITAVTRAITFVNAGSSHIASIIPSNLTVPIISADAIRQLSHIKVIETAPATLSIAGKGCEIKNNIIVGNTLLQNTNARDLKFQTNDINKVQLSLGQISDANQQIKIEPTDKITTNYQNKHILQSMNTAVTTAIPSNTSNAELKLTTSVVDELPNTTTAQGLTTEVDQIEVQGNESTKSVVISIPSPTPSQEQILNNIALQAMESRRKKAAGKYLSNEFESFDDVLEIIEDITNSTESVLQSNANKQNQQDGFESQVSQSSKELNSTAVPVNKPSANYLTIPQLSPLSQPTDLTNNMATASQQLRNLLSSFHTNQSSLNIELRRSVPVSNSNAPFSTSLTPNQAQQVESLLKQDKTALDRKCFRLRLTPIQSTELSSTVNDSTKSNQKDFVNVIIPKTANLSPKITVQQTGPNVIISRNTNLPPNIPQHTTTILNRKPEDNSDFTAKQVSYSPQQQTEIKKECSTPEHVTSMERPMPLQNPTATIKSAIVINNEKLQQSLLKSPEFINVSTSGTLNSQLKLVDSHLAMAFKSRFGQVYDIGNHIKSPDDSAFKEQSIKMGQNDVQEDSQNVLLKKLLQNTACASTHGVTPGTIRCTTSNVKLSVSNTVGPDLIDTNTRTPTLSSILPTTRESSVKCIKIVPEQSTSKPNDVTVVTSVPHTTHNVTSYNIVTPQNVFVSNNNNQILEASRPIGTNSPRQTFSPNFSSDGIQNKTTAIEKPQENQNQIKLDVQVKDARNNIDTANEKNQAFLKNEIRKQKRKNYQQKKKQAAAPSKDLNTIAKKRQRRCSRVEEDYDTYIDGVISQLHTLPPLRVSEPVLDKNISTSIFGFEFDSTLDLHFGKLTGTYGCATRMDCRDYYSNGRSVCSTETTEDNPSNSTTQRGFYDQEFPPIKLENEDDRNYIQFCREDSPDSVLSSSSVEGMPIEFVTSLEGIKLNQQNNDEELNVRLSPVIPIIVPVPIRFHHGLPYIKNAVDVKENYLSIPKQQENVPTTVSDVTVTLTLTSSAAENIISVLKDLSKILKITTPKKYELSGKVRNCLSNMKFYRTYANNKHLKESIDIQGILNGTITFCKHCGTSINDVPYKGFLSTSINKSPSKQGSSSEEEFDFCSATCYQQRLFLHSQSDPKATSVTEVNLSSLSGQTLLEANIEEQKVLAHTITEPHSSMQFTDQVNLKSSTNDLAQVPEHTWKDLKYKFWSFGCFHSISKYKKLSDKEILELLYKLGSTISSPRTSEDDRKCILCHISGDCIADGPARLLNYDVDKWVHLNCALWSSGVYETVNGALMNFQTALQQGLTVTCVNCNALGATIRCFKTRCSNVYHLACAVKTSCVFMKNKTIFCSAHIPKGEKDAELTTLAVYRRVYINRDENRQVASIMHHIDSNYLLRVGSLILINIGQLLPHQLHEFHDSNNIYPLGYKIVRFYWSMRRLNKRCIYICSIDEYMGKPQFKVVIQEPQEENIDFIDDTVKGVWNSILLQIEKLRKDSGCIKTFPQFVSGDELFGLTEPAIVRVLESLPGVESLPDYKFKYGRNPLLELPLAVHPSGAARTEPKTKSQLNWKRLHTQRTTVSSIRPQLGPPNSSSQGFALDIIGPYSKQFVHTKSSQYKKMKLEWRNNVYLARSKIQGLGLYAARDLEKHTMVIEYIGEIIRTELAEMREKQYEEKNRGIYMFRLDEDRVIDATLSGGLARYINHSCNPNCVAETVEVDRDFKIIIFSKRRILRHEELAYDYKFDIEDDQHKISCMCGSSSCRKWMN